MVGLLGEERSKQSAALGLPMEGASSLPTSLQKFQASKPTLNPSLPIPGSPTAEILFLATFVTFAEEEEVEEEEDTLEQQQRKKTTTYAIEKSISN